MAINNFDKTELLLPCEGSNNGTTFTDYSKTTKTVTATGAVTSTSQYKYGTSSAYFDGSNDILAITPLTNFAFGTGDFTIALWWRPVNVTTAANIFDFRTSSSTNGAYPLLYVSSGTLKYYVSSADRITSGSVSTNTWYYIELSRSGTSTKLFIDGVQAGSTWSDSMTYLAGSVTFGGAANNTGNHNCYIDDIQIVKGAANHTADFTPPTSLLKTISGTVKDDTNTVAIRTVRAYPRLTGLPMTTTTSAADGTYSLTVPDLEHSVIVLDDDVGTLYNDIIMRVIPG